MLVFALAVAAALVFSFLCSLSEATLLSLGHTRVATLAESGTRAGGILRRFKQHPDLPIAGILVLNTIAVTAGPILAGSEFEHAFPHVNPAWFAAVFTVVVLLFTEIAPKTLGVVHCNRLAVPVAHFVDAIVRLLRPVLWVTRLVSRAMGAGEHVHTTSLEEIRLLATAGQSQGLFGALTAGIIANATRLRETPVRDVMVPRSRMAILAADKSLAENLDLVQRTGHSRYPFSSTGDIDRIEGIVLAKELLFQLRERPEPDWADLLAPLLVLPETTKLNHVLRAFQREKRHLAVVVDEYGSVQGMVTLEDVLEEIVGEIEDERGAEATHIVVRRDGALLCRGIAETRRVFQKLGLQDQATDSKTLSGFLAERLGNLPQQGAVLDVDGWRFRVTKANNRRAERVLISRRLVPPEAGSVAGDERPGDAPAAS